jgi:GNAT superfamily N-acetyltransferase
MFAEARRRLYPASGAEWMQCGGAYAVFNGIDSPVTQTFGLGVFEELNIATMEAIERFFFDRGSAALHEVSPFAGVAALDLLCARQYRPVEISNVMFRGVEKPVTGLRAGAGAEVAGRGESATWTDVLARGWAHEHPEHRDFLLESGAISAACEGSVRFLARIEGCPGAAASLFVHEGVALLAGGATVPEVRRRGLQAALIEARIRYAFEHGCDLLMTVAEVGSNSQRNAERNGFRVAYTRTKWRLGPPKAGDKIACPTKPA